MPSRSRLISLLCASICMALPGSAQSPSPQPQSAPYDTASTEPAATFQINSRMVTVELVARDSKGNHITGLKPADLRLFEQIPSQSKEKREQKIASLREVHMADLEKEAMPSLPTPPGVYSNGVKRPKESVPPTILLVDGLNTAPEYQAQIHAQMTRMLQHLPPNVPVAVFLFGTRLTMLQSFTTDPRLLQIALRKAHSVAGVYVADVDPLDDPNSPEYSMGGFSSIPDQSIIRDMVAAAANFDREIYTAQSDIEVERTIDAMLSIGRNLAGYPGRKNLLWLSTAFPITINGAGSDYYRNYWVDLRKMNGALSDAKISVYPVNVAGVQTLSYFSAATGTSASGAASAVSREQQMLSSQQDTMETIADGTGGKICTGDNDLGDCVRKAMDDSSDYYELSYYPDSPDWNGQYRKILLSAQLRGARLSYRQGYFATLEGGGDPKAQQAAFEAECGDYLDATSVIFNAESVPADAPGQLQYALSIDPTALTLAPTADGNYEMKLAVAVCTYNDKGWPLQVMNYPIDRKLDAKEHDSLLANGSVEQAIFVPAPKPAAVLLMVKDIASGHLGSIHINVEEGARPPSGKKAAGTKTAAVAPPALQ